MISDYYTHTASVYTETRTSDSMGAATVTRSLLKTVACLIQPVSAIEIMKYNSIVADTTHLMFCAYDATILTIHVIQWGSDYYNIIQILNPTNMNHHLEIQLKKI